VVVELFVIQLPLHCLVVNSICESAIAWPIGWSDAVDHKNLELY